MNIALITDENYITPTGTAIASILQSNPVEHIHFYVITKFLSDKHIAELESFVAPHKNHAEIEIIRLNDNLFSDFPIRKGDHVSAATYYRIFFTKLLPESIHKLLYIDGDTLCVDSIADFYNTDLDGFSCAAIHDESNDDARAYERLKYPPENGYFNAGVMLINLDWWRKNDVMQKCVDYISAEPDSCLWHDQDALNHVLNGTVRWADFRYNFMQGFFFAKEDMRISPQFYESIDNVRKNPCILHFSSAYKPWHIECNHPLKKRYRLFYKEYTGKKIRLSYRQKGIAWIKWHIKRLLNTLCIKSYADFRKPLQTSQSKPVKV